MEASIMSDEEKRQLVNEFRDPQTIEFRRVVIAKRLLEDIMQRECPRLIARHESGRALYDEDLALLVYYYQDRLDENLKKLIAERNIPQIDSERYISEYFEERIHKQVALFAIKESAVRLLAESAIKTAVQTTTKSGFSFVSQFFSISKSVWTINFAVGAGMMLVDLGHSLRLWWKGEITGIGLIKRMTSSLASNSLGLGGGTIGAILGAFLGPLGALAGSLIGGLLGALFGKLVNDLFWRLFEEDPEIAREKLLQGARDVLGVMRKDNFTIITQKWRSMILLTHPDKNPNADSEEKKNLEKKFCEVHTSYKILKAEMERLGLLSEKQSEEISKTSPIQVLHDGWLDY